MPKIAKWVWVLTFAVVSVFDLLTTYWIAGDGIVESNATLDLSIKNFGPVVGVFVIGLIVKIGFLFLSLILLEQIFKKVVNTIKEKEWRIFCHFAVYTGLLIYILIITNGIAGNLAPS